MKYELFSHKILIEGEYYDTYGINVTDCQNNKYVFEDVTTFLEELEVFVDFLNKEKPSLNCFKILLENFIENI